MPLVDLDDVRQVQPDVWAIAIAHCTRRIVWQNIVRALGVKAIFITLEALGLTSLWGAVFADDRCGSADDSQC